MTIEAVAPDAALAHALGCHRSVRPNRENAVSLELGR